VAARLSASEDEMGKVAVMGAGSWGTAFAMICADAGAETVLWARRDQVADVVNAEHRNPDYLGDRELPQGVHATSDPEEALRGAEAVALAVPSHALRDSLEAWRDRWPEGAVAVSLIKGIELATHKRASEVIQSVLDLPPGHVLAVSGPNLAKECADRMPSGTVAAGPDLALAEVVQKYCHTAYFRVYTNTDLVGVELGGAVKNVIAIAAGMADGMGYGDNTKATIITRGLAEMTRLGVAMGGKPMTFAGLAGMGDLVATCTSRQSRNRYVGEELGKGRSLQAIIDDMHMVAEGVKSSRAVLGMAEDHRVEMPITEQVVAVVHDGQEPRAMAEILLGRTPKAEFHGLDQRL
jgi:glycerol-3-phosphate dehydrogenase (NAD(P)+)